MYSQMTKTQYSVQWHRLQLVLSYVLHLKRVLCICGDLHFDAMLQHIK